VYDRNINIDELTMSDSGSEEDIATLTAEDRGSTESVRKVRNVRLTAVTLQVNKNTCRCVI